MEEQILHYYLNHIKKFFILFIIIIIIFFSFLSFYLFLNKKYEKNYVVNISKGESLEEISNIILFNSNIIEKKFFYYLLRFQNTFFNKIHYGEFQFKSNTSIIDIINIISNPSNVLYELTVVDGWQKYQLDKLFIDLFEKNNDIDYEDILADTYIYQSNNTLDDILNLMKKNKNDYFKNFDSKYPHNEYSINEIMIIASLVEKEGIDYIDKKKISSVIFNRLQKKMKLQIDASTIFAITRGNYKLSRPLNFDDLKIKDKYNTYYIKGLPPKPICFVSRKTIEIVLENYKSDYLFYFYDKYLKKHIYSKNFDEHKIKLQKYRNN